MNTAYEVDYIDQNGHRMCYVTHSTPEAITNVFEKSGCFILSVLPILVIK